jgi:hypothetical protein
MLSGPIYIFHIISFVFGLDNLPLPLRVAPQFPCSLHVNLPYQRRNSLLLDSVSWPQTVLDLEGTLTLNPKLFKSPKNYNLYIPAPHSHLILRHWMLPQFEPLSASVPVPHAQTKPKITIPTKNKLQHKWADSIAHTT